MSDQPRFYVGQILLAMPGIGDPRFDQSVIAMCAHDEDGALGINIGSVLPGVDFVQLLRDMDIDPGVAPAVPVHNGGPVERNRGFVLHSLDWGGDGTVQAAGRWALTGTTDVLKAIAAGKGPSRWLVALGYAGWGEGQLDGEMRRHGWHVTAGSDSHVFDTPASARWTRFFEEDGIDPRLLASSSGNA